MVIREIPSPVSPASKKQNVEDLAKRISKKTKTVIQESMDEVVPESNFEASVQNQSPIQHDMDFP